MYFSTFADRVSILCRGPGLHLSMSRYLIDQIEATPNIDVRLETEVVGGGGDGRLAHLELRGMQSGEVSHVDAAALFVLIGARPHTEWLPDAVARDERGFVRTGLGPRTHETSVPGLFAVGDVRCGSVKRVASAVGEGSAVIPQVHEHLAAPARVAAS
jgi:thioredoxin reductase (NADPH)